MINRILITTALEETWPDNNQPVLFLGEWCRRYSRKEKWGEMNVVVAPYHWDDRVKLYKDYQFLQKIYERLLSELVNKLNQIHAVNHSQRYWRILIGPWLGYFIQMLFDRWFMLKEAIENNKITNCRVLARNPMSVVSNDMMHFNQLYIEDDWNEAIYGQLLHLCWDDSINIEMERAQPFMVTKNNISKTRKKNTIKRYVETGILLFNKLFPKQDSYFFISSYLPLKEDFMLQIRLGQFPNLWRQQGVPTTKPDLKQRKWVIGDSKYKDGSFELIIRQMIPHHIPTAYLEGYNKLLAKSEQLNWPKNPKAIFTSNSYLSDDLFKVWAAEKTESGSPLIIGQHGGHFGLTPFAFHEEHQIEIADKWISWGWDDQNRPQIIPFGNLKTLDNNVGYDPNGNALMVEMAIPRFSYHLFAGPISRQFLDYLEDQKNFINTLPRDLKKKVLVRLHPNDYGWDLGMLWRDQFPEVKIDNGNKHINKIIKKCRIYISTYNATTFLESLTLNVPTIIFWNEEHWELNDDVKPYFDLLNSVGIFHYKPESAAQMMAEVWNDVESWWKSHEVQNARTKFCKMFSNTPNNPLKELVCLLREATSS